MKSRTMGVGRGAGQRVQRLFSVGGQRDVVAREHQRASARRIAGSSSPTSTRAMAPISSRLLGMSVGEEAAAPITAAAGCSCGDVVSRAALSGR
jgi:hypothetical protein